MHVLDILAELKVLYKDQLGYLELMPKQPSPVPILSARFSQGSLFHGPPLLLG
jgi:hypothetical protein